MDKTKHQSHLNVINSLFQSYDLLDDLLCNPEGACYEEWTNYTNWINRQKELLKECLMKLENGYSYGSIFPVLRTIYENFWFINLAMNGTLYYRFFNIKKGHDIEKIYRKWKNELITLHNKGESKDCLEVQRIGKRLRVTYRGPRMNVNGKPSSELVPRYYFLVDEYNPTEAYVGKQKKIIEKYLLPPHLFHRFTSPNMDLRRNYFEFQKGIIPHLLLNKIITNKQKQKIIIHYNFLSLWVHPNKVGLELPERNTIFGTNNTHKMYWDRLVLLYIGNLTSMFLELFLNFLIRQEKESKIKTPDEDKLNQIKNSVDNFHNVTSYFWFIFNKPSFFYKYNYSMNKIWRQGMFQKNIKKILPQQIKDSEVPYYNDPLEILKKMSTGYTNVLIGEYIPEIKWE